MNDPKFEQRKENYRKCNFNILESREKINLQLRKQKLDDFLMRKRLKISNLTNSGENSCLEIIPSNLNIDSEYKNKNPGHFATNFELIFNMLNSNEKDYQKFGVYCLRDYVQDKDFSSENGVDLFNDQIIETGMFKVLTDILFKSNDDSLIVSIFSNNLIKSLSLNIKYVTLWTLINLTCPTNLDSYPHYDVFLSDEFIERFFQLMKSQYLDILEQTIWLLTHLVSDCAKLRDKVINSKIYGETLKTLRKDQETLEILRLSTRFLSNIFKTTQTTPSKKSLLEALIIFSNYIYTEDQEIMSNSIWGLYYISQFDNDNPDIHMQIVNSGAIVKVMKLNFNKFNLSINPSIRLLGNLLTGPHDVVDVLLSLNILDFLDSIVDSFPAMKMSIAWASSNIAAGSYKHVCQLIDSRLMDSLFKYYSDCDYKVKREIVSTLQNAVSTCSPEVSSRLLSKGVMDIILDVLSNFKDPRILFYCLETLQFILNSGECFRNININGESGNPFLKQFELRGGSTHLEMLQSHQNQEVFQKASEILNEYFSTESIN